MILDQKLTDPLYSLGALGMGFVLYRFSSVDLRSMYPWGPRLLWGWVFLLFAALGERHSFLPLALLQLGFGIFGAYIFTLLLYLGSRTRRKKALSVVATGQGIIMGSVLLGVLLTKMMEPSCLLGRGSLCSYCQPSRHRGYSFFSGVFFRDSPESFAGYDLEGGRGGEVFPPPRRRMFCSSIFSRKDFLLRKIRVALLVVQGFSNGEISQELNITGNTLRTHLRKIHKKVGSANRKDLREELLSREG